MTPEAQTASKLALIVVAAAAAALIAVTVPAAFAGNAGASLPACYNHVIDACNKTSHPQSCAKNGMDACDKLHSGKSSSNSGVTGLRLRGNGRSTSGEVQFQIQMGTSDLQNAESVR